MSFFTDVLLKLPLPLRFPYHWNVSCRLTESYSEKLSGFLNINQYYSLQKTFIPATCHLMCALHITLDLYIPEKELAQTRSQISLIYFQHHWWYSVSNFIIPKGIYENQVWTLDLNSGPLASQVSILPLSYQSCCIMIPESCPSQDPSWGNKSAKPVKVTGKNDSSW